MYFWRIIFTYIIAFHHLFNAYGRGCGWYIGVDFFAIMSGYLLQQHIHIHEQEDVLHYTSKRFAYFCPIVTISGLVQLMIAYMLWYSSGSMHFNWFLLEKTITKIVHAIPEFLLLNTYELLPSLNGPDWYIQALFVVCIPAYYLLKHHKNLIIGVIAPLVGVVGYSCLIREYGCVQGYMTHHATINGIMNWSLIRVASGLMLGILAWKVSQDLRIRHSGIISSFLFVLVILLSKYWYASRYDFLYIITLFVAISLGFSSNMKRKIWTSQWMIHLSNLTIFIYLNHYILRNVCKAFSPQLTPSVSILYFSCVTLLSISLYRLTKNIRHCNLVDNKQGGG